MGIQVIIKLNPWGENELSSAQQLQKLDAEWTKLILTARDLGLSVEEVHNFIQCASRQSALKNAK